jgi:hypothetical protein
MIPEQFEVALTGDQRSREQFAVLYRLRKMSIQAKRQFGGNRAADWA